jgi:hypothetical protein
MYPSIVLRADATLDAQQIRDFATESNRSVL